MPSKGFCDGCFKEVPMRELKSSSGRIQLFLCKSCRKPVQEKLDHATAVFKKAFKGYIGRPLTPRLRAKLQSAAMKSYSELLKFYKLPGKVKVTPARDGGVNVKIILGGRDGIFQLNKR